MTEINSTPKIPQKKCRICQVEYPATEEFFYRHSDAKDKLRSECRKCQKTKQREYSRIHAEKRRAYQKNYVQEHQEEVRKRKQQYYKNNKERINKRSKENYRNNREERLAQSKAWSQSHPESNKAAVKRYNQKHKEEIRARQRKYRQETSEQRQAYHKKYKSENREFCRLQTARHRARKRKLAASFSVNEWETTLEYFNHCCAYCGSPAGLWHRIVQDHFIPLSSPDCPGTIASNIVPACHAIRDGENSCNPSKSNTHPLDWLIRRFGKKKGTEKYLSIKAYLDRLT